MSSFKDFGPILMPVLVPSWLLAVALGAIMPVAALAALSIGSSQSYAAVLVGIMGAVSLCFTIPAGILIDRIGDTRAMIAAAAVAIVVLVGIAVAMAADTPYSLPIYTLGLMLLAPVTDVWSLARQALVADTIDPAALGMAMTALGGSQRIGNLVGPLIGAGLMLVWPIWSVFIFAAVLAALATVVVCLPSGRALDSRRQRSSPPAAGTHPVKIGLKQLEVRWGAVLLAGVAIIALTVARAGQPIIVQLWGVHLGLHRSGISLLVAVGAALELLVMFIGGYLKDRLGRATVLVTCLSVFGVGFLLMVLHPSLTGLAVAVAVMALGNGLGAGVNMTIGADLSPRAGRARFLGVWAMFNNVGKLGGPSVIALVIAVASLSAGIVFTGLIALVGAAWMACVSPKVRLPGRRHH